MSTEQESEIQEQDDLEQEEGFEEVEQEEEQEAEQEESEEQEDEDEIIISIEGEEQNKEEEEAARAPSWVREVRKTNREQARRIKELESKLQEQERPQQSAELPPEPQLDDPDIDYDADKFKEALLSWSEKKRAHDAEQEKAREAQENAQKAWNAKLEGYAEQRTSLKVNDFEDAEAVAQDVLSPAQYAIIINGAENPAKVVYAIGKDPRRAKEFAEMTDLVQFSFKVAKLEDKITVSSRKAPPPERTVSGSGPKSGTVDSTLERLRAEAEKTGDISKVVAYKRQLRNKA